jgi:hypothetical protein
MSSDWGSSHPIHQSGVKEVVMLGSSSLLKHQSTGVWCPYMPMRMETTTRRKGWQIKIHVNSI